MSPVSVMVILDAAVVDHGGEVGVLVVVRSIVVAVGVGEHCQSGPGVP